MRNRIAVLLLIPACLCTFIGSIVQAPEEITPATEETVLVTTIQTIPAIETTAPTTEPTIPEPTEPPATEPVTEPEEQDSKPISLGVFTLTAYCSCQKCCGKFALNRPVDENGNEIVYGSAGIQLEAGISIAVDPSVIPYGTQVIINGHTYTAHDTGGKIVGNRIDVYFDGHQEAWDFGIQYAEVFVYNTEH